MKKNLLVIGTALLMGQAAIAQNLKLSQYTAAPQLFNPASTGKFNGSMRAGMVFSKQKTDSAELNHMIAFADYKLGGEEGTWGAGISMYQNYHPEFSLTGRYISGSLAKHFAVDEDMHHQLSVGGQLTLCSGKSDPTKPAYTDKISGGGFRLVGTPTTQSVSYMDMNMGLMYTYRDETITVETGLGAYHLLAPAYTINKKKVHQPRRLDFTVNASIALNDNNELTFTTMMWREGLRYDVTKEPPVIENLYGVSMETFVSETTAIYYGLSTRSAYSLTPLVGMSFNNNMIRIKASYEQPINKDMYEVKRAELSALLTL